MCKVPTSDIFICLKNMSKSFALALFFRRGKLGAKKVPELCTHCAQNPQGVEMIDSQMYGSCHACICACICALRYDHSSDGLMIPEGRRSRTRFEI